MRNLRRRLRLPATDGDTPRTEIRPIVASLLAFTFFITVRVLSVSPLTGDEPHYLVLTQSILSEQDLKVANNYARGDHLSYYPGHLDPHIIGGENPRLRRYSIHAPGLSILIAPAFAVAGPWGAIIMIAALVSIGTGFVWSSSYLLTGSAAAAWFGWAALTLTSPIALFGSLVYPDAVAGAGIAVGVWTAIWIATADENTGDRATSQWPPKVFGIVGAVLGVLPWLHTRLAIPAAALVLILSVRIATIKRSGSVGSSLLAFLGPVVVSGLGWLSFFWFVYGSWDPRSQFAGTTPLGASYIVNGLAGLLADQEFGLLPNAPVYLLAVSGIWRAARVSPRLAGELGLLGVPYAVATSAYPMWWGGHCPPARFLVPVIFPLAVLAAMTWARTTRGGRLVCGVLLVLSVVIASIMAFPEHGRLAYNDGDGTVRWAEWLGINDYLKAAFPSFFDGHAAVPAAEIRWPFVRSALLWSGLSSAAILLTTARLWRRTR